MPSATKIPAGNTVRSTVTFVPEAPGTVDIVNVSVRVKVPPTVTGAVNGVLTLTDDIVDDTNDVFHVDIIVPDTAAAADWLVRWESNTPSAKIAVEDETTRFTVVPSALPSP